MEISAGCSNQDRLKRIVSTASFIEESKAIHGDLYDYGKTAFTRISYKVIVGCPVHGEFEIVARDFLNGKGCPRCAKNNSFIAKLEDKFGEKFGYDRLDYIDSQTPVELICPTHGSFFRTPSSILASSCGCPQCGEEKNIQMREEANRNAAIRREEKEREDDELLIYTIFKEVLEDQHAYVSSKDISNFYMLENLLRRLDNRSLKRLIHTLQFEQETRPAGAGKSRAHFDSSRVCTTDSFVALDFETLFAQRVSACSIGMVKYKEGVLVDKYYSLIQPPRVYPGKKGPALTWVHGFTEDMFEGERTFDQILPEMETFAEGLPLVAHNSCVERACIREASAYYGLQTVLDIDHILDTYPLSHVVEERLGIVAEGGGTHSLDAVCRRFGIETKHHHNALDDAEMCGDLMVLFHKIMEQGHTVDLAASENCCQPQSQEGSSKSRKINPEDKIQRTDLESVPDNPFKDKICVLTGFSKIDSQHYAHQLNELGAVNKDTVTKKTDILITGATPGPSKLKKAEELGILIMSEAELLEIIKP